MIPHDLAVLADSAMQVARRVHRNTDSTNVASPLPGGISAIVRFLMNVPQWVQIGGIVLGAIVALVVLWWAWPRRVVLWRTAITWLTTRSRPMKIGLAVSVVVVLGAAAGGGAWTWHYTQHDNGFCTGCHVMAPAFQRFTRSEHDKLECHDCHQQPLYASTRQLVLWVAERPDMIGKHAKVENHICERCHVTEQTKGVWQHIKTTAGHRTHLESDSSVLKNIKCVTCHGAEVHRFRPIDSTCAQAGCHVGIKIQLGKMGLQTGMHCVACHNFTADVPRLATRDSAAHTLYPKFDDCTSCHKMASLIANFDPAKDPHKGTCGFCHNPHTQTVAKDANKTCTTAACHSTWRNNPFHVGANHAAAEGKCTLCHVPHHAKVDPSDCTGCHMRVAADSTAPPAIRQRLQRVQPYDTSKVLRHSLSAPAVPSQIASAPTRDSPPPRGKGDVRVDEPFVPSPSDHPPARSSAPDSFPHQRHATLACLKCHVTSTGHGRLTFEAPRGCMICHHQDPANAANCSTCHRTMGNAKPESVTVAVAVGTKATRPRSVMFRHAVHDTIACAKCHTTPVSRVPGPAVVGCIDCHSDHHTAGRSCVTCHAGVDVKAAHALPADAHVACDNCHAGATIARLLPDRSFCITCHVPQTDHHAEAQCTVCHMLATPEQYRARLAKAAGSGGAR